MSVQSAARAIAILLAVASLARTEEISLLPEKDNTIYATPAGDLSNGAGQHFMAGRNKTGSPDVSIRRGLIAFDLSLIPPCSTIESVTLTLFMDRTSDVEARVVGLYRLLKDWGEGASDAGTVGTGGGGGLGAPAAEGDATSLYTFYNEALPASSPTWTAANAEGDYVAAASATTVVGTAPPPDQAAAYSWTGAGMVEDVRLWVEWPDASFGWIVKTDEVTPGSARRFETRENINNGSDGKPDYRPRLTIRYLPAWSPSDFDQDGDVDQDDAPLFRACSSGPTIPLAAGCEDRDFDHDNDVDQDDFGIFQRCFTGAGGRARCDCAVLDAGSRGR